MESGQCQFVHACCITAAWQLTISCIPAGPVSWHKSSNTADLHSWQASHLLLAAQNLNLGGLQTLKVIQCGDEPHLAVVICRRMPCGGNQQIRTSSRFLDCNELTARSSKIKAHRTSALVPPKPCSWHLPIVFGMQATAMRGRGGRGGGRGSGRQARSGGSTPATQTAARSKASQGTNLSLTLQIPMHCPHYTTGCSFSSSAHRQALSMICGAPGGTSRRITD